MGETTQEGVEVWILLHTHTHTHTHTMKARKTLCGGLNTKKWSKNRCGHTSRKMRKVSTKQFRSKQFRMEPMYCKENAKEG